MILRTRNQRPRFASSVTRISGAEETYLNVSDLMQFMRASVPDVPQQEIDLISAMAFAAEKALENALGICIQETVIEAIYKVGETDFLRVPRLPFRSIVSITDVYGATLQADDLFANDTDPVIGVPNIAGKSVAVRYNAGWETADIPAEITEAIRQYANVLYQAKANNQPEQQVITFIGGLPIQVRNLIMQYKNYLV